jgi:hypothetical protein
MMRLKAKFSTAVTPVSFTVPSVETAVYFYNLLGFVVLTVVVMKGSVF